MVQYMHKKGYAHRDIKLENILIDSNCNIKLADFALSTKFSTIEEECKVDRAGTMRYLTPEMH